MQYQATIQNTNIKGKVWAVVLAGGDGVRLQTLTQRIDGDARPKQFSKIFGNRSLLGHTRERLRPIIKEDGSVFVVTRSHEKFYRDDLADVASARMIEQPMNRGTGVAIIAALLHLRQHEPDAVVATIPSDHYYADDAAFRATVRSAIEVNREHPDSIVLVGAKPQWPEVEYGWIEPGASMSNGGRTPFFRVNRFWEKPHLAQANELMRAGGLWNTFVTIGRTAAFLKLLMGQVPSDVVQMAGAFARGNMDAAYHNLGTIDFSRDVLSRDQRQLLVIPDNNSGWADLGNPVRVIETLMRNKIAPLWLFKMLEVPRVLEEVTGVRQFAHIA